MSSTRRDALKKIFNSAMIAGSGGLVWGTVASSASVVPLALRPPGALGDDRFLQACVKCGQCVVACPYDSLLLTKVGEDKGIGTPFFEPRNTPCYLCTNYPCITACPSGALITENITKLPEPANIENARMGLAVIHKESCIAFGGIQCDVCYRACPLMGKAIVLEKTINEFTGKHANLKPVVNSDYCTGCGICENVCVVEKAAIFVLPVDKVTGKTGDHYVESWKKNDEERIRPQKESQRSIDDDVNSAIDYLNSDNELFDE